MYVKSKNNYVRNLLRGKVDMVIVYYCIIYDLLVSLLYGNLMFDAALRLTVITPPRSLSSLSVALLSLCP